MSILKQVNRKKMIYITRFAIVSVTSLPTRSSHFAVKSRIGSNTLLTKQVMPTINSSANFQEEFRVNSTYYRQKSTINTTSVGSGFEYLKKPLKFCLQQDRKTIQGKRSKTLTIAKAEIETTDFIGINQPILKMIRFDLKNPKKHRITPFLIFAIQISMDATPKSIPILLHTAIQSELKIFFSNNETQNNASETIKKEKRLSVNSQPREFEQQIKRQKQIKVLQSEELTGYTNSISSFGSNVTFLSELSSKSATSKNSKQGKIQEKKNKPEYQSQDDLLKLCVSQQEKKQIQQLGRLINKKKKLNIEKKRSLRYIKKAKKKIKLFKIKQKKCYLILSSDEKEFYTTKVKLYNHKNIVAKITSKFEEMKENKGQIEDLNEINHLLQQLQKINKECFNQQNLFHDVKDIGKITNSHKDLKVKEKDNEEKAIEKKLKIKKLKKEIEQKKMLLMKQKAQLKEINMKRNQLKTMKKKDQQKIKLIFQNNNQEKKLFAKKSKQHNNKKKEYSQLEIQKKNLLLLQKENKSKYIYERKINEKIKQITNLKSSRQVQINELKNLIKTKQKLKMSLNNEKLLQNFQTGLNSIEKKLNKIKMNQKKYQKKKRKEIEKLKIQYNQKLLNENKTKIFELKKNILIHKNLFKLQQSEYEKQFEKRIKLNSINLKNKIKKKSKFSKKKSFLKKTNQKLKRNFKKKMNIDKKIRNGKSIERKKKKKKNKDKDEKFKVVEEKEIKIGNIKEKNRKKNLFSNLNGNVEIEIIKEQKKRLNEQKHEKKGIFNKLQIVERIEKEKWLIERLYLGCNEKVKGLYPIPATVLISFLIKSNSFDFGCDSVLTTYIEWLNLLLFTYRKTFKKNIWLMSNIFWSIRFLLDEMKNFPKKYYLKKLRNERFKCIIKDEYLNNKKKPDGKICVSMKNEFTRSDMSLIKIRKQRLKSEIEPVKTGSYINFNDLVNDYGSNNNEFLYENRKPFIFVLYEKMCVLLNRVYLNMINIIKDQLEKIYRKVFSKYSPSESKIFEKKLISCTNSVVNLLRLIIQYCDLTKLPNIVCQGFIRQTFFSINAILFNYLLRKKKFLTVGHCAKIKESLSKIEGYINNSPFSKSKKELRQINNLIDLIFMNKVILKEQENNYFLCTNILNSISVFQIFRILSNFTPDRFDPVKINKKDLDKLLEFALNKTSKNILADKIELNSNYIYSLKIDLSNVNCKNWHRCNLPINLQKKMSQLFSEDF